MLITIKMTPAQVSAIECSGILETDEPYFPGIIEGNKMMFCEEARQDVSDFLTTLANAEDGIAEDKAEDATMRGFARRACSALCNLQQKLRG